MTKIRITNRTVWPTAMLRPFLTRIAREEFPGTKPGNTKRAIEVEIRYTRGGWSGCSGYAYSHSTYACIRVPHPKHGPFPVLDFCHVVGHEFGHLKGVKHRDMGLHYERGAYSNAHYAWALTLPRPTLPVKRVVTTEEKRLARLTTAKAAVERWTRKRKLADTKLKRWARKVRTIERTLAAAACAKEAGDAAVPN